MAKKSRITTFTYKPTKEDKEAMSICNDNHCFIYPLPLDNAGTRYQLQVHRPTKVNPQNRIKTGTTIYTSTKSDWYRKIFELYKQLKLNYVKEKNKTK